jgi:hypothetical protein
VIKNKVIKMVEKKDSSHGLEAAYLLHGKVYAALGNAASINDIMLRVGKTEIPFSAREDSSAALRGIFRETEFDVADIGGHSASEPAETRRGELFGAATNMLEDWILTGSRTVQIWLTQRDKPLKISFRNELEIGDTSRGWEFQAFIASHRADADLIVSWEDLASGDRSHEIVHFRPEFTGGALEEGHQKVHVSLPKCRDGLRISFAVAYNGYNGGENDPEPFLFISAPRVVASGQSEPIVRPVRLTENRHRTAEAWAVAPLPRLIGAGEKVQLVHRDKVHAAHVADIPTVRLQENYGHTLILTADAHISAVLVIDGEPVESVSLSETTVIRILPDYLNGCQRHVCIKDRSASQIIWETITLLPNVLTPVDVLQRESTAPFPAKLLPQTARRYESLKAHVAAGADGGARFDTLPLALQTLEGGYDNVKLQPLQFPERLTCRSSYRRTTRSR